MTQTQTHGLELLTGDELAALLKVHKRTINRLCQSGRLPRPIKLGKSLRWRKRDIETVLSPVASD